MGKLYPLPDFDLAPLEEFDRDLFLSSGEFRKVNGFILSLALIYNDIKSLLWVDSVLENGAKESFTKDPYCGQVNGMRLQMTRYLIGILHELLELIRENEDVVSNSDLTSVVDSLPLLGKKKWQEIVNFSCKKNQPQTRLTKFLDAIRNNSSFHYHRVKNQMIGFDHWYKAKNIPGNDSLCVSIGKTPRQTRFYFADAASEGYLDHQLTEKGIKFEEVELFASDVIMAIHNLIKNYLKYLQRKQR